MWTGTSVSTFRNRLLPPSSRFCNSWDKALRRDGVYTLTYTTPSTRRLEIPSTPHPTRNSRSTTQHNLSIIIINILQHVNKLFLHLNWHKVCPYQDCRSKSTLHPIYTAFSKVPGIHPFILLPRAIALTSVCYTTLVIALQFCQYNTKYSHDIFRHTQVNLNQPDEEASARGATC